MTKKWNFSEVKIISKQEKCKTKYPLRFCPYTETYESTKIRDPAYFK